METTLTGIKVATIALNLPGPVCSRKLKALGADVIKIEPPNGDPMKHYNEEWYNALNNGQEIKVLNLKDETDRDELSNILSKCDVLLTSSRPQALKKLGLDWDTIHDRFNQLCCVQIVGHPPPLCDIPGHDLTYVAEAGLLSQSGLQMPNTLLADLSGAESAIQAIICLLFTRERTGHAGCHVVSLLDSAKLFSEPLQYGVVGKGAILGGSLPSYSLYDCMNGTGTAAVACLEPHFAKRLESWLQIDKLNSGSVQKALFEMSCSTINEQAKLHDLPVFAFLKE